MYDGKLTSKLMGALMAIVLLVVFSVQPVQAAVHTLGVYVYASAADMEARGLTSAELAEMVRGTAGSDASGNIMLIRGGGTNTWKTAANLDPLIDSNLMKKYDLVSVVGTADITGRPSGVTANMASGANLTQFLTAPEIDAAVDVAILWGHGAGPVYGLLSDPLYNDKLTLLELEAAMKSHLSATGKKFKVVVLNSCLMGSVEVADALAPYAEYAVLSEGSLHVRGIDYEQAIRWLWENPYAGGADIGNHFLDALMTESYLFGNEKWMNASVIDLSKVPALVDAVDALGSVLIDNVLSNDLASLMSVRAQTESYGVVTSTPGFSYDLADLGHLTQNLIAEGLHPEESEAVYNALKQAVVHHLPSDMYPNATGLSIWFPFLAKEYHWPASLLYDQFAFARNYQDFASALAETLTRDETLYFEPINVSDSAGSTLLEHPLAMSGNSALGSPFAMSDTLPAQVMPQDISQRRSQGIRIHIGDKRQAARIRAFSGTWLDEDLLPLLSESASFPFDTGILPAPNHHRQVVMGGTPIPLTYAGRYEDGEQFMGSVLVNGAPCIWMFRIPDGSDRATLTAIWDASPGNSLSNALTQTVSLSRGDTLQPLGEAVGTGGIKSYAGPVIRFDGVFEIPTSNSTSAVTGYEILDAHGTTHWLLQTASGWEDRHRSGLAPSGWAIESIGTALSNHLLPDALQTGYHETISRQAFATLAVRLYGALTGAPVPEVSESPFADTNDPEIAKAWKLGIVNGTAPNRFEPDKPLTREQLAVMMTNVLHAIWPSLDISGGTPTYVDAAQVSSWAKEAVLYLNENKILNGIGGNRIAPAGTATKEQAVVLANNMYNRFSGFTPPQAAPQEVVLETPNHDLTDISGSSRFATGIIEITNYGDSTLDLSGWILKMNASDQRFTFPKNTVLAAGASLVVTTGPSAAPNGTTGNGDAMKQVLFWTKEPIFSADNGGGGLWTATGAFAGRVYGQIVLQAK